MRNYREKESKESTERKKHEGRTVRKKSKKVFGTIILTRTSHTAFCQKDDRSDRTKENRVVQKNDNRV